MMKAFLGGGCFHVQYSAHGSQFQERKLSNQQNREGRSLRSRPSFRIVRGLSELKGRI